MSNHKHFGEGAIRKWHHPAISLESLGLREGMTFMDIGCGYGFFTIPAAQIVGEAGKVYAVDIDAASINQLKRDAAEKGLKNIHTEVAEAEETVFCDECADIIFYNTVLHDFRDPAKVLRNAKTMVKPSGKLVNVDWKKKPTGVWSSIADKVQRRASCKPNQASGLHHRKRERLGKRLLHRYSKTRGFFIDSYRGSQDF